MPPCPIITDYLPSQKFHKYVLLIMGRPEKCVFGLHSQNWCKKITRIMLLSMRKTMHDLLGTITTACRKSSERYKRKKGSKVPLRAYG